jgi:hypothetical protein
MPRMNRHILRVLTLAALSVMVGSLPAGAQEASGPSAYNIELVIFRVLGSSASPENWAAEANPGAAEIGAGEEATSGQGEVGHFITALPASAYQLGEIESRLRSSGQYLPVAHVAWSQTASSWGSHGGLPLQRLGISVPGLTGNVIFEKGLYLHLGMLLSYAVPNPPASLAAPAGTVFTINENRRIKFYDRNYFDHPAFGVIALVSPAQGKRPPGR